MQSYLVLKYIVSNYCIRFTFLALTLQGNCLLTNHFDFRPNNSRRIIAMLVGQFLSLINEDPS
jgi:hypothetical protein